MTEAAAGSGFRHVADDVVYSGHSIRLSESRFAAPDGTEFTREIVRHPGAVCVVPVLDDGTVVLVRQYRAALDRLMLEIPAGKLDVPGEPLEEAAQRELQEEVGLRAGNLELLVRFHNSVGFTDEVCVVYRATDLTETPVAPHGIEEQYMEIVRLPLADTPGLIAAGEITDAKTVIGLTLAVNRPE